MPSEDLVPCTIGTALAFLKQLCVEVHLVMLTEELLFAQALHSCCEHNMLQHNRVKCNAPRQGLKRAHS